MKLKYIVTLELDKFEFEDGNEALKFAELAMLNHKPGTYRKDIEVYINIVMVVSEEAPEEESEDEN